MSYLNEFYCSTRYLWKLLKNRLESDNKDLNFEIIYPDSNHIVFAVTDKIPSPYLDLRFQINMTYLVRGRWLTAPESGNRCIRSGWYFPAGACGCEGRKSASSNWNFSTNFTHVSSKMYLTDNELHLNRYVFSDQLTQATVTQVGNCGFLTRFC